MSELSGKVGLVTGSGRNIGRAIALRLASAGADVVLNARANHNELEIVAREIRSLGRVAVPILADVATAEGVDRLFERATLTAGKIDILVHTVAIRPHVDFLDLRDDVWERVRSTILDSAVRLCRVFLPGMAERKFGRIVLFTGRAAYIGSPNRPIVSAAKMGLIGLARGLATDFANRNIRVNIISPG